jgi:nucleotide-binding universal stress UspA family protein
MRPWRQKRKLAASMVHRFLGEESSMYSSILVPIDGSPTAKRGLDEAMSLAASLGSTLHVLNVVDAWLVVGEVSAYVPPQQLLDDWRATGERLVADAMATARAKGIAVDSAVRCDPALRVCDAILDEARSRGAELIVMGTHGRRGLKRVVLGSDAELVLRESPVPVLLVREPLEEGDAIGGQPRPMS